MAREKLRSGLPHIATLKHGDFHHLIKHGAVKGHVTEKSDGMAFGVGHDEHGFYTRSSGSDKMRHSGDYLAAAKAKFGHTPDFRPEISQHFDKLHQEFRSNPKITNYLADKAQKTGGHSLLKGEMFYKPLGKKVGKHGVRFVGTTYDSRHMGTTGKFVVHSGLPENQHHDLNHVNTLGNHSINMDNDVPHQKAHVNVDVRDIIPHYHKLNHALMDSRTTPTNKKAKLGELEKLKGLQNEVHNRVDQHIAKIKPKWGKETEGFVVHPHSEHKDAPRFKMVSSRFTKAKEDFSFKKKEESFFSFADMVEFLAEGGNVKVGGVGSEPIHMHERSSKVKDIHNMFRSVNKATGHELFGKHERGLHKGTAYAGSTRHMMNPELSDSDFGKHKKSFGDVDVQVPHHTKEKLESVLKPGTTHANFSVVGTHRSGDQISAIMHHKPSGKNHQVDFEYKEYDHKTHEPTKFSQFSNNSDLSDMKSGLSGAHHKFLLQATTAAHKRDAVVTDKKGVNTHGQHEVHSFSTSKGLRERHAPVMDGTTQKHVFGTPVFRDRSPKEAEYDTDLKSVHQKLFGAKGTRSGVEAMHSFHGTAGLIKKHFNPTQQADVVSKFKKNLETGEKSPEKKAHAMAAINHHFPDLAHLKEEHEKPKDFHVAMAAGAFRGGISSEHEKLINNLFSQKADKHYLYVQGPAHKGLTNKDNPLTVHEKVNHLKKLYPDHKDSFIAGTTPETKGPMGAMVHMYHKHKNDGENVHLHIVAGTGDAGVTKNAGGSLDTYSKLYHKYNGTKFSDGSDDRMKYKSLTQVPNPRGTTSGSVVRKTAVSSDHNNPEHVSKFASMIHSGYGHEGARKLMKTIKSRSKD